MARVFASGLALCALLCRGAVGEGTTCTADSGPTRALGLYKPGVPVSLEEGFGDPPAISRVQCWWQCHGSAFTEAEIDAQLSAFSEAGMGGVTVKDTLAMPRDERTANIEDVDFMSDRWLAMFAHCVAKCTELGLICRCRLGSGWNAGGPWVTPELSSQMLRFAESGDVAGPGHFSDAIPLSDAGEPTAEALDSDLAFVLLVAADGHAVDITERVTPDRRVDADIPDGTWRVVTCYMTPSNIRVLSASPSGEGLHHDHLSAAGTDLQLERVAEPIRRAVGRFENTAFDGFNCDSWEMGKPTWTAGFRDGFRQRRGYDPAPYLPWLRYVEDDQFLASKATAELPEIARRFLFDLRTTASERIAETHYRRVSAWCREHGVAFEAEAAGGPSHSLPKDFLLCQGQVDIPMGEFWMHGRSYVKIASSAAHAYGKRLVALESFTETRNHFAISPAAMKLRADEAFLLGGNYLTAAVSEYSPVAAGKPGWVHNAGPHLNRNQPWWPVAKPFFDYLGRCCFLLQSGEPVSHVAVYYTFLTAPGVLWSAPADDDLSKRSKAFSFDYVNDDLVQRHMEARDGRIVLPSGMSYSILYVVPTPEPTMPLATLECVRDLARQGATVVWAGDVPERCPGLSDYPARDAAFKEVAEELRADGRVTFLPRHDYEALRPILEGLDEPPAWHCEGDPPLRFVHRKTDDADIFFIVNRADHAVEVPVTFRIGGRVAEIWNPDSGVIRAASCRACDEGVIVDLAMAGHESTFIVFRESPSEGAGPVEAPVPVDGRSVAVAGPWEVTFPDGSEVGVDSLTLDELRSLSEVEVGDVRHLSGFAAYHTTFECPEGLAKGNIPAYLDLGNVAEVAQVLLNGEKVGVLWHSPYRLDISGKLKPGKNTLEVGVYNLWHNRIVGDALLPKDKRVTRMVPERHYERMRDAGLVPSGLIGPIRIAFGSANE